MMENLLMFIGGVVAGGTITYFMSLRRIRSLKKRVDYYYYKFAENEMQKNDHQYGG